MPALAAPCSRSLRATALGVLVLGSLCAKTGAQDRPAPEATSQPSEVQAQPPKTSAQPLRSTEIDTNGGAKDPDSAVKRDEARRLFLEGVEATRELRWKDAVRAFRQSYALSGSPSALLNLGLSQRSLGEHLAAYNTFDTLINMDKLPSGMARGELLELREEAMRQLATLRLTRLGPRRPKLSIHIDGQTQPDSGHRPLELRINAGTHSLVVREPGFLPFIWNGTLAPRSVTTVAIQRKAVPPPEKRRLVRKAWFWLLIGTAAAGVAVTLGLTLRGD
ncbi:MAG: hypothetical protein ACPGUV_11800, partial [Polyangiales bacterium]